MVPSRKPYIYELCPTFLCRDPNFLKFCSCLSEAYWDMTIDDSGMIYMVDWYKIRQRPRWEQNSFRTSDCESWQWRHRISRWLFFFAKSTRKSQGKHDPSTNAITDLYTEDYLNTGWQFYGISHWPGNGQKDCFCCVIMEEVLDTRWFERGKKTNSKHLLHLFSKRASHQKSISSNFHIFTLKQIKQPRRAMFFFAPNLFWRLTPQTRQTSAAGTTKLILTKTNSVTSKLWIYDLSSSTWTELYSAVHYEFSNLGVLSKPQKMGQKTKQKQQQHYTKGNLKKGVQLVFLLLFFNRIMDCWYLIWYGMVLIFSSKEWGDFFGVGCDF